MSDSKRRPSQAELAGIRENLLRTVDQELQEGYLEVEVTGLTLSRLLAVYSILARNAWQTTLGNLRSRLRPTPAL